MSDKYQSALLIALSVITTVVGGSLYGLHKKNKITEANLRYYQSFGPIIRSTQDNETNEWFCDYCPKPVQCRRCNSLPNFKM